MQIMRLIPTRPHGFTGEVRALALKRIIDMRQKFAPGALPLKPGQLEAREYLSDQAHLPANRLVNVFEDDMVAFGSLVVPYVTTYDTSAISYSYPNAKEARYFASLFKEPFLDCSVTHIAIRVDDDPHRCFDLYPLEYAGAYAHEGQLVVHIPMWVLEEFDYEGAPE